MAVNKTVNKRTNSHGAIRNCIEYVLRQDKTNEQLAYVTGPYPHEEINYNLVYRTFLEEKKLWNKDSGRMYAHNIISWHKDEKITPEQAFEFGKEFAENWFSGFQTLVAVHKDKNHIRCHLVTNSVSYEDGRKLHNTKKDLERMKQLTNQMCRERGLTVVEKGKHFDGSQIEKGEVIAWSKDKYNLFRQQVKDSFVADCAMAVLKALENCINKEKFIEKMKQFGWNVNWTEKRKHITFQNQAEREKKRTDVEIQRARKKAKSEIDDMKERQFFWDWGYLTVIFFSLLQNGAFQRDVLKFITIPINWGKEYIAWFEQLEYISNTAGEMLFKGFFSMFMIAAWILGSVCLVWAGVEQYKKIWDDLYKMVLISSISFAAVLGNLIRAYLPLNLLLVILLINTGTILLRAYLKKKYC
ncbi:relaxase/mobilization nuclease domain-containing protein [Mediterraneibacter sp. HCN-7094]